MNAEELQPDEYIVDLLLKARGPLATREFLVKWRQYPRSAATWEPEKELRRRCSELIDQYDLEHPLPQPPVQPSPPSMAHYLDEHQHRHAAKIMLLNPDENQVYAWRRRDGDGTTLDLPGGSRDISDASDAAAMLRELSEELHTSASLDAVIQAALNAHPQGCQEPVKCRNGKYTTIVHVWAVVVPRAARRHLRPTSGTPYSGDAEGTEARFYPIDDYLASASMYSPSLARACNRALEALDKSTTVPVTPAQPPSTAHAGPTKAKFERGAWAYHHFVSTPRGLQGRWHPAQYFDDAETTLSRLRQEYMASQSPHRQTVINAVPPQSSWPRARLAPSIVIYSVY